MPGTFSVLGVVGAFSAKLIFLLLAREALSESAPIVNHKNAAETAKVPARSCDLSAFHPLRIGSHWPGKQDIVSQVEPEYPDAAKRKGISGLVIVRVLVKSGGDVGRACALSGPIELREPAEAALLRWRFRTPELNGHAVEFVEATISVRFSLDGRETEEFVWRAAGREIGRLRVPPGFKVEAYNYREGIVTSLRYPDGATIVLQAGGMYSIPMFQKDEHEIIATNELVGRTKRIGRIRGTELLWREDNFPPKRLRGGNVTLLQVFPPNIGYLHVTPDRRAPFDAALDSFVRTVD